MIVYNTEKAMADDTSETSSYVSSDNEISNKMDPEKDEIEEVKDKKVKKS